MSAEMTYEKKKNDLLMKMAGYTQNDTVVAFSGGADSSLLLKIACDCAKKNDTKVYAVLIRSVLQPQRDYAIAKGVAAQVGAQFEVLDIDELSVPGISNNSLERCYICKKHLFSAVIEFAHKHHALNVLEGTNADDLLVYRPGIRAIRELGVFSPLADCGFTKAQVRQMASEYGVSVANRPSSPCMATRFPYGTMLSAKELRRCEQGEAILREAGFYNVRLRVHDKLARIEIDRESFGHLLELSEIMIEKIKALGYDYVTLDLEGFRSGSMDLHNSSDS